MTLWIPWWKVVRRLRPACSRTRTFLWLGVVLAALTIRSDLLGVTSFVRALGLRARHYDRLLDFFHSSSLNVDRLTRLWVSLVLELFPGLLRVQGRLVLVGDGIKVPKSGRKMPAVKKLHQESNSNTKPPYIMGHSCQAVALLAGAGDTCWAVPLAARIHEGLIFSNRDQRTLLDKRVELIASLNLLEPFYFLADAYYASRTLIRGWIGSGNHLISRVRSNAVAYQPVLLSPRKGRGRPRQYGAKIRLRSLWDDPASLHTTESPLAGEKGLLIRYRSLDLLWRPVGLLVRFVAVIHPRRGALLLLCTDLTLAPLDILRLYAWRFKIEVSFKSALRILGTYTYHFWMKAMTPLKRFSGPQYLHRKSEAYRQAIAPKMEAYHRHIQIGILAQGLLQYLSSRFPQPVWTHFGSWIRTVRPGICPSEQVTALALKNTLPEFLADCGPQVILAKFLLERIDFSRSEGLRLAG